MTEEEIIEIKATADWAYRQCKNGKTLEEMQKRLQELIDKITKKK